MSLLADIIMCFFLKKGEKYVFCWWPISFHACDLSCLASSKNPIPTPYSWRAMRIGTCTTNPRYASEGACARGKRRRNSKLRLLAIVNTEQLKSRSAPLHPAASFSISHLTCYCRNTLIEPPVVSTPCAGFSHHQPPLRLCSKPKHAHV